MSDADFRDFLDECFFFTGFMCCTKVLDKDGVSAGSIIAEMAAKLATEDKTLTAKLDELYHR